MTYQGEILRRKNRITDATVVLLDREKDGDWVDFDGRWCLLCDTHSTTCGGHPNKVTALHFLSHPEEWCEDCTVLYGDWLHDKDAAELS